MSAASKIHQPWFVSIDEIETIQELALADFGGLSGLRDRGMLESALAQPPARFGSEFAHDFPFGMAAAYAFHIARNHPFLDGNKRAAFGAAVLFLHLNGWEFVARQDMATQMMLSVASGQADKAALADWFAHSARPRPSYELRDFFRATTMETVMSAVQSMMSSGRSSEVQATLAEASEAMPIIGWLTTAADEAERAGDDSQARTWRDYSVLLTVFFRNAEDAGYDW